MPHDRIQSLEKLPRLMLHVTFLAALAAAPTTALRGGHRDAHTAARYPSLDEIFAHNRKTRNSIKSWVTDADINASIYGYGLTLDPHGFAPKVALDTGPDPIQHDFISQLGARMAEAGQTLRYMEIGVAVLKGIWTQANFFENATLTAVDIEDPNPTIESLWSSKRKLQQWRASDMPGNRKDMRRQTGRATDYINQYDGPNGNEITYVAGDAFNAATYDHIKDGIVKMRGPMNLVFSDAFHTGAGVIAEVDGLLRRGIIKSTQEEFSMVWDDCHGPVAFAVEGPIFKSLREAFAKDRTVCTGWKAFPGWIGHQEGLHRTCIFTTLDLEGLNCSAGVL